MPYAHLWASGTRPYLDQWYEYPPATIPLFYIPHFIDKNSHDSFLPINYGQAYRGQLLIIDTLIFILIWKTLNTLKLKENIKLISLGFYILSSMKAHDFIYDSMDLVFAAGLVLSVTGPIIFNDKVIQSVTKWIGYWLAVALKYINGPLGLVGIALEKKHWKKEVIICGVSLLLIWGIPLFLYRSSLSVSLVYHQIRGVQIDSVPAVLIRMINESTHSEKVIEIYKNYEISGPITTQVSRITSPLFLLAIVGYIGGLTVQALKIKSDKKNLFWLSAVVGYIILFLLTGKVLSRPFLLWLIPLITIIPYQNIKQQLSFILPTFMMIFISYSAVSNNLIGPFPIPLWVGIFRSFFIVILFISWWQFHSHFFFKKTYEKKRNES